MAAALVRRALRAALLGPAFSHSASSGVGRWPGSRGRPGRDEERDWEQQEEEGGGDEGPALEQVARLLKRQQKTILFQKMKRKMEPRVPIKRSLTWAAMEQIRQLNHESPEEWTVARLAEGFNVDPDVIRRVLRSRFSPPLAVKLNQDRKVAMMTENRTISGGSTKDTRHLNSLPGKQSLGTVQGIQQKRLPGRYNHKDGFHPALLQLPASSSSVVLRGSLTPEISSRPKESIVNKQSHWLKSGSAAVVPALAQSNITDTEAKDHLPHSQEQDIEEWDGEVLSEQELERLAESGDRSNMKIVQRGREFFDCDGNFLYRV
ncbi:neugrin [Ambystoma mexicanum]|uniref:neugrin n=1 Tax=Ambystoma mexicanum TaxID=8296 RepID=UPI0037E827BB